MEIFQIIMIAIVASLLFLVIQKQNPTIAMMLVLVTSVIIIFFVIGYISDVLDLIGILSTRANINMVYLETILQIIGISYITEFGAHIIRDAGLSSIAAKVELAGKVFILVLAIPILTAVIETIFAFLPN